MFCREGFDLGGRLCGHLSKQYRAAQTIPARIALMDDTAQRAAGQGYWRLVSKNEGFCMKTEELCIKNEEFVFKIVYFAGGDRSGPQNMAVSRGHDPPAGQERRGFMNHYPTKKTVHYMFQHVQCVRIPRTSDFYI